jgi:hypothetical protein
MPDVTPTPLSFDIASLPPSGRGQLLYALHFCDPNIASFAAYGSALSVTPREGATPEQGADIARKVARLIGRYSQAELALSDEVFWSTGSAACPERNTPTDPYPALVAQNLVHPLPLGRAVLRGWLADLIAFVDHEALRRVAQPFNAAPETYPNAIDATALAKTMHLQSFPEHLHFIAHLTPDLDIIDGVAAQARTDNAYTPALAARIAASSDVPALMLNPSVCYHAYASRAETEIPGDGITVTARSRCHRFEGGALSGLRRLSDFDMREVIFIGRPEYVKDRRATAEQHIRDWAAEWGMATSLVNANDPFFTDDFEVKAAFQRRQDLKHELTVPMPTGSPMAISSSNFHSTTFGKAFSITRKARPVCSGCIGFGLERWAYALCIQFGPDPAQWPAAIRAPFAAFRAANSAPSSPEAHAR